MLLENNKVLENHPLNDANIVILIPAFKHPVLLVEALDSVLAQNIGENTKIHTVIVSDGCPFPETKMCGLSFQSQHPDKITFLEKQNGGPSSARNYGIRYVLNNFPQLEALYFLDADNRISPNFINTAITALRNNPQVTWVYPHINSFEVEWTAEYNIPYSRLLHITFDNICDTGSMIRAHALQNLRFNEDAKSGFEDWDFWLSAVAQGHIGMCVDTLGFEYRNRAESRFKEVSRDRSYMLSYLRDRYKKTFSPRKLVEMEHEDAPRFALFEADIFKVKLFSDPLRKATDITLPAFARDFWASMTEGDKVHIPAHFLWSTESVFKELDKVGILHNVLWLVERLLQEKHFVAITLQRSQEFIKYDFKNIEPGQSLSNQISLLAGRKNIMFEAARDDAYDWLKSVRSDQIGPLVTEITIHAPFDTSKAALTCVQVVGSMLSTFGIIRDSVFRNTNPHRLSWRPKHFPAKQDYYLLLRDYLGTHAIMPRSKNPKKADIGFIFPFASFGGSEKVGYAAAQQLRKNGYRTHAFVLGSPKFQIISEFADAFDSINVFGFDIPNMWGGSGRGRGTDFPNPTDDGIQMGLMKGLMCTMDAVVNCQSSPMNAAIGELKALGISTMYYIHLFDKSRLERDVGHPDLGLLFEHAYELYLLCSHNLRHRMYGLGIPQSKLMTIENAPSFTVPADQLENIRKKRQTIKRSAPLRVLYLGRLDAQKGIERVLRVLELTTERKLNVKFRMVGASLVDSNLPDNMQKVLSSAQISMEKPIFDTPGLTQAMASSDVMILPSRWEGAPLVILEAQQVGCIPIATDVGAVSEQINSWEDGVMIENTQDETVAQEFVDAIEILSKNAERRSVMARQAMDRVANVNWENSFVPFIELMEKKFNQTTRLER